MKNESTEIFARNWKIYQEVSKCNYMSHHDFYTEILSLFQKGFIPNRSLDVLDCGCGDAWMLSRLLKGRDVNRFTGYDMSDTALSFARKRLEALDCEVSLQSGPMEESVKQEEKSFDFIYSSFAIHHLQDADKKKFLQDLHKHLKDDGRLIIIDLLRNNNLDRQHYLEEYIQNIGRTWLTVIPEDLELVYDHIRRFDFPATAIEFVSWMEKAGFSVTGQFSPDSRNVMITATKK